MNLGIVDYDNRSALHVAAAMGDVEVVVFLTSDELCVVNPIDRWGGTPLDDAITSGHTLVARLIASRGGRVHPQRGSRELLQAAVDGAVDSVRLLVSNGCDVNCCDYDGRSALARAAAEGHLLVVDYLVHAGADINRADRRAKAARVQCNPCACVRAVRRRAAGSTRARPGRQVGPHAAAGSRGVGAGALHVRLAPLGERRPAQLERRTAHT